MKISRRQRRLTAAKVLSAEFEPITAESMLTAPKGCTAGYQNNTYTVLVYDNHQTSHGPAIRIMVQRHDNKPLTQHWRTLYSIKNTLFGSQTVAIEYYPPLSELIDTHNIYWLWIYPAGVLPKPVL